MVGMTDRTPLVPDRYDEYTATCDDGCFTE